jgi:hypothetical protein
MSDFYFSIYREKEVPCEPLLLYPPQYLLVAIKISFATINRFSSFQGVRTARVVSFDRVFSTM